MAELDRGAGMRVPRIFGMLLKYVSPVFLLLVFGFWLYQQISAERKDNPFVQVVTQPAAAGAVALLLAVLALFLILIAQSVRRWNAMESANLTRTAEER
jgi:hypothetical protein